MKNRHKQDQKIGTFFADWLNQQNGYDYEASVNDSRTHDSIDAGVGYLMGS